MEGEVGGGKDGSIWGYKIDWESSLKVLMLD
jgi:hypothetical protein